MLAGELGVEKPLALARVGFANETLEVDLWDVEEIVKDPSFLSGVARLAVTADDAVNECDGACRPVARIPLVSDRGPLSRLEGRMARKIS